MKDLSYGVSLGLSEPNLLEIWQRSMNDSSLIRPVFTRASSRSKFENELLKLVRIFDQSHVIVTHVSTDASSNPFESKNDPVSTFYYFDGSHLLERADGKVWLYGHTHSHADYVHPNGCRLIIMLWVIRVRNLERRFVPFIYRWGGVACQEQ